MLLLPRNPLSTVWREKKRKEKHCISLTVWERNQDTITVSSPVLWFIGFGQFPATQANITPFMQSCVPNRLVSFNYFFSNAVNTEEGSNKHWWKNHVASGQPIWVSYSAHFSSTLQLSMVDNWKKCIKKVGLLSLLDLNWPSKWSLIHGSM